MKRGKQITIRLILVATILWSGSNTGVIQADNSLQFSPQLGPFFKIWDDVKDNYGPAIAYNPIQDEYLVVWVTKQDEFSYDIWGRRVGGDGTPIPNGWFNIDNIAGYHLIDPAIVYNPNKNQYLVVYSIVLSDNDRNIWGKIVDWNGGLSNRISIDNRLLKQESPSVTYNNQDHHYLVAYSDWQASGSANVYMQTLDENGNKIGNATISSGSGEYRISPDVAYIAEYNHFLLVYAYEGSFIPSVLGKTISANLVSLSPEFHFNDDGSSGADPKIACSLNDCLVTWSGIEGYQVRARRLSNDGLPLGPNGGFEIAQHIQDVIQIASSVSVFDPWGYLITWNYFVSTTADQGDVFGRVVGFGDDIPRGNPFSLDIRPNYDGGSDMACGSISSCLLVDSHCSQPYPGCDSEINGRLVYTQRIFLPLTIH